MLTLLRLLLGVCFCVQVCRSTLPLSEITCIKSLEGDGWEMVFLAHAGNNRSVYAAWTTGTDATDVKPIAIERSCSRHYRDPRVGQWSSLNTRQVKLAIYQQKSEVAFFIFDAAESNYMDWFHPYRVIAASYSDTGKVYTVFSIGGVTMLVGNIYYRRFFINDNYDFGSNCKDLFGLLAVTDVNTADACNLDPQRPLPQIHYSTETTSSLPTGYADFMAIFIKTT